MPEKLQVQYKELVIPFIHVCPMFGFSLHVYGTIWVQVEDIITSLFKKSKMWLSYYKNVHFSFVYDHVKLWTT